MKRLPPASLLAYALPVALALGILLLSFFGEGGLVEARALERERLQVEARALELQRDNDRLRAEILRQRSSRRAFEREVAGRLQLGPEGAVLYRFSQPGESEQQ